MFHSITIKKMSFQGDDAEFDAVLKAVAKKMELTGHHIIGNQAARKRFEAMLAKRAVTLRAPCAG